MSQHDELALLRAQVDAERARLVGALNRQTEERQLTRAAMAPAGQAVHVADVGARAPLAPAANAEFMSGLETHGLALIDADGNVEKVYLHDGVRSETADTAIDLVNVALTGDLALAVRRGKAFGLSITSKSADVVYVSGVEGEPQLTVRVEAPDGTVKRAVPIVTPRGGDGGEWLTGLSLVAAVERAGNFFEEDADGDGAIVVAALADIVNEALETVERADRFPWTTRIRRLVGEGLWNVMGLLEIERDGRARMTVEYAYDRGARVALRPCVIGVWSMARAFTAARHAV